MQRYFVHFSSMDQDVLITGDDAHHMKHVMRMKIGDAIYLSNGETTYYAQIKAFSDESVRCEKLDELEESRELEVHVAIAQGMPKADKFEWIIQKTTELGVGEIIPVLSERSIIKIDPKKEEKKIDRYQKIAKEASEQSHRTKIPKIEPFMSFKEFLTHAQKFTHKVVAYEATKESEKHQLAKVISELKPKDSLIVFIGPEGGISEGELDTLVSNGFIVISLGNRILRTETAPIFFMSSVVYELEVKG